MFFFPGITPQDRTYRIQESIQLKNKKLEDRRKQRTNKRRMRRAIKKPIYDFTRDYRNLIT
jgi:hypothetical protein